MIEAVTFVLSVTSIALIAYDYGKNAGRNAILKEIRENSLNGKTKCTIDHTSGLMYFEKEQP